MSNKTTLIVLSIITLIIAVFAVFLFLYKPNLNNKNDNNKIIPEKQISEEEKQRQEEIIINNKIEEKQKEIAPKIEEIKKSGKSTSQVLTQQEIEYLVDPTSAAKKDLGLISTTSKSNLKRPSTQSELEKLVDPGGN